MVKFLIKKRKAPTVWLLKASLILTAVVFSNLSLFAQVQIKGMVTDSKTGETLPGVSILVEGSTTGIITNMEGKYSINVPSDKTTLSFSFMGYVSQKINVEGQSEVNVALSPEVKSLDDVVVVGYGTMRRADLTGSVSSLSAKELKDIPVTSAAEAITGRLAGVSVTTTDGSPDADIIIRVRGGGSVTQDNSPLYIVDGFPVKKISDIAPNDIATIDVLKDAATTAIFGSEGANGVIMITTKSAKAGKTSVSYNGYGMWKTLPKELSVLSPYEFVRMQYELATLKGTSAVNTFVGNYGALDDLELYKAQPGTDWQKEVFGRTTFTQSHNLSIMGGSLATKYNLSVTHIEDPGLMIGTGYGRTNVLFKLNHELTKSLKLDLNTRYSDTRVDGAGTDDYNKSSLKVKNAVVYRPVNGLAEFVDQDMLDLASQLDAGSILSDPVTIANQSYRRQKKYAANMNGGVSWIIAKGLTARSEFGYEYHFDRDNWFYGPLTTKASNNLNLPYVQIINTTAPIYRMANTLTYNATLGDKHELTIMAGQENKSTYTSTITSSYKQFPKNIEAEKALDLVQIGVPDPTATTTNITPNTSHASFFGRANYAFNKRYLFAVTYRADGSSKFAPGKQWGYFPAASAAWRISEEDFLKNQEIVSALKLRGSYGSVGNDRIPDDLWRTTYKIDVAKPIGFAEISQPYYDVASTLLTNPNLKWETTITRNIGLDFGLFKDRLSGTLDLYKNTTKDLLVQSVVPGYTGYVAQMQNVGQTSNKGIELTLNGVLVNSKRLTLTTSFNIAMNRSNVDALDAGSTVQYKNSGWASSELREVNDYALQVGKPVGQIYGYISDGFYKPEDFNYNSTNNTYSLKQGVVNDQAILKPVGGLMPGSLKLKKLGTDTATVISADNDRTIIGNTNPLHTGGFNINLTYNVFDLFTFDASAFFNWVYGNKVYNANKIDFTTLWKYSNNNMLSIMDEAHRYRYIDDAGNKVTDPTALSELNQNATIWSPYMGNPVITDWAVEDGSFLRLNNLTFGFSAPKKLISKIKMEQLRVYFTIHNAWIWTNYSGYDPEVSTLNTSTGSVSSPLTPGVDYSAYPKNRSYTIGLNLTF